MLRMLNIGLDAKAIEDLDFLREHQKGQRIDRTNMIRILIREAAEAKQEWFAKRAREVQAGPATKKSR